MSSTEVVDGVLRPDGTLELSQKVTVRLGPVRVTMEPIDTSRSLDVWTVLEEIWTERRALGLRGRTRAEIDAQVRSLRNEWDDVPLA